MKLIGITNIKILIYFNLLLIFFTCKTLSINDKYYRYDLDHIETDNPRYYNAIQKMDFQIYHEKDSTIPLFSKNFQQSLNIIEKINAFNKNENYIIEFTTLSDSIILINKDTLKFRKLTNKLSFEREIISVSKDTKLLELKDATNKHIIKLDKKYPFIYIQQLPDRKYKIEFSEYVILKMTL